MGDTVTVGHAVTLDTDTANLAALTVESGASLTDDGVAARRIYLSGPLSNSGTIALYTNGRAGYIQLGTDSTWSGNGSITANHLNLDWHRLSLATGATMTITLKDFTPLQNSSTFNGGSPANSTATLYLSGNGVQILTPWTGTVPNLRIGGSGTKTALAGTLDILGSLTIDSGSSFDLGLLWVTVNIKGSVNNSGTFGPGMGTWTFNGTSAQTISSAATFQSLVLNNGAGLTLGGDLTLGTWGTVTLQSGRITTGSNKLVVPSQCDATWINRATGTWINGNVSLTGPPWGTTCVFHVGDANNYAPITFTYPWSLPLPGGTIIGSTSAGDHADTIAGTSGIDSFRSVNRTWTLSQTSGTYYTFDAKVQFCSATGADCGVSDVDAGANYSNFVVAEKVGSTWSKPTVSARQSDSITTTGLTLFGTFATGEAGTGYFDHLRIEHSGTGLTCMREPVIIKACQDAACATPYTTSVSLTLSPTATWYTTSTGGAAINQITVTGSTTMYYERTTSGTVTLGATSLSRTPANGVKCYVGGTETCSLTFRTSGLIITDKLNGSEEPISTQIAGGTSGTYYLRAVGGKDCGGSLAGDRSVDFAYECLDPSTCHGSNLMTIIKGGTTTSTLISRNNSGSVGTFTGVTLTFDANGNAPFSFSYADVGKVRLHMRRSTASETTSNDFVVKPSGFELSNIKQTASPNLDNPGAADASGDKFVKAGEAFSATVTAKAGTGTAYSFGREATPQEVTLSHALVAPSGGEAGAVSNAKVGGNNVFANGVATVSDLAWSEVGVITLTPSNKDYLGVEGVVTGTTSGNVGRFYPHRFDTEVTHGCAAGHFTYSGQPFTATAIARAAGGNTTTNYAGDFARAVTLSDGGAGAVPCTDNCNVAAARFAAGVATLDAASAVQPTFAFAAKLTAPSELALRATESAGGDGVTSNVAGASEGTTALRSGRLRLSNIFGSERTALRMQMQVQYWSGDAWVINALDKCTALVGTAFALSGLTNITGITAVSPGNWTVDLAAPGARNVGVVDVAANLGTTAADASCLPTPPPRPVTVGAGLPWLRSRNGNCPASNNFVADPSARATFGIYPPESRRTVHVREGF